MIGVELCNSSISTLRILISLLIVSLFFCLHSEVTERAHPPGSKEKVFGKICLSFWPHPRNQIPTGLEKVMFNTAFLIMCPLLKSISEQTNICSGDNNIFNHKGKNESFSLF